MSTDIESKAIARQTQTYLKELGYEVKLGHVYSLLSKMAGYKTWNVASKKKNFIPKIAEVLPRPVVGTSRVRGKRQFRVTLAGTAEVVKDYIIQANDEAEAASVMKRYFAYHNGKHVELCEQVKSLIEQEDYSDFRTQNWLVADGVQDIEFESIDTVLNWALEYKNCEFVTHKRYDLDYYFPEWLGSPMSPREPVLKNVKAEKVIEYIIERDLPYEMVQLFRSDPGQPAVAITTSEFISDLHQYLKAYPI